MPASRARQLLTKLPPGHRRRLQHAATLAARPICSVVGGAANVPAVSLTFDDGPDVRITPAILDVLHDRQVQATFFLLAERAEVTPGIVERIVEEGHEVALHGLDHTPLPSLTRCAQWDHLMTAAGRLQQVAGTPVRYFRPPFGAQTPGSYLVARRLGLEVVMWSCDPKDFEAAAPETVSARTLSSMRPGDIVLLHDGWDRFPSIAPALTAIQRARALEQIVDGARRRGVEPVPLQRLLDGGVRRRAWFTF
jgi:peptidoglycan/xylan/chitin deacetylase (PgdA/CDA1 family)